MTTYLDSVSERNLEPGWVKVQCLAVIQILEGWHWCTVVWAYQDQRMRRWGHMGVPA